MAVKVQQAESTVNVRRSMQMVFRVMLAMLCIECSCGGKDP